jgi:hypothetical protein
MAGTLANRKYVETLEADMKKLKQEKTAAEVRVCSLQSRALPTPPRLLSRRRTCAEAAVM